MIKTWSKFNENNSDDFRQKLADKIMEVRNVFLDFEDMDIISYSITTNGYEKGVAVGFNPKTGDFNRFMDMITPSVKYGLEPDENFEGPGMTQRLRMLGTRSRNELTDKTICVIADIKIPAKSQSFLTEFGSLIQGDGIKLFEDILVANSRLIDSGYDVMLDLNGSHHQYKPAKFLIYFDI
jgi:hypothetical protein